MIMKIYKKHIHLLRYVVPNEIGDTPKIIGKQNKYHSKYRDNKQSVENKERKGLHQMTANLDGHICPECNFSFSTDGNLRIHLKNIHSKLEMSGVSPAESEESIKPRDYICKAEEIQDIQTSQDHNLKGEKKEFKIGTNKFKCEQCPYTSTISKDVKRHTQRVHDKTKDYSCRVCGHATSQKSYLRVKNFKCEQCPFGSSFSKDLKRHIKGVHDKIKNHICLRCGYATARKDNLDSHKRICKK